ncbi:MULTISPECIES: hypothetical protein [unclassified Caballeronia]|uniref:hypothetical protein n=1 Tax=unclassified Caballeronia TaxID=2646786 RepID=UPI00285901CB|nr:MULTISPECIES: hypothetical protein [unclassified Caballeronia]MDR5741512.1 hypothetical protein [Caballeronia sp. LZ016]MDR5806824.1 hypothetical protein [Caballeronia sp. LZ019]
MWSTSPSGRFLTFSMAGVAAAMWTSLAWCQSVPKQGTIEATYTASGADVRNLTVSGDDAVFLFESTLLMTNNNKSPLMQNVTARCVEAGFSAGSATGYCVYSDKDGDKFIETYTYQGGSPKGKGTLSSGTGKYKGIQGQFDWEQVVALPSDKGTYNYIGKKTGSYRIP